MLTRKAVACTRERGRIGFVAFSLVRDFDSGGVGIYRPIPKSLIASVQILGMMMLEGRSTGVHLAGTLNVATLHSHLELKLHRISFLPTTSHIFFFAEAESAMPNIP